MILDIIVSQNSIIVISWSNPDLSPVSQTMLVAQDPVAQLMSYFAAQLSDHLFAGQLEDQSTGSPQVSQPLEYSGDHFIIITKNIYQE